MNIPTFDIAERLEGTATETERLLAALLQDTAMAGEIARPGHLMAAIRHGALNGGKRLRPFLVVESARLFDGDHDAALRVGAALECIHCYSLVHDDLPAMDDDAVRRGRPAVHVAFDEATAILAGDGLQALAFDILASPETGLDCEARLTLVRGLAQAAGIGGMVGGQALDLAAETTAPEPDGITRLQAMKTGALLSFACEAGAVVAGAGAKDRARLVAFGSTIGVAFQLADDLLDVTADADDLGKATGKDAGRGKATLVGLNGVDWARRRLDTLVGEACQLMAPLGARAEVLIGTARFVAERRN